MPRVKMNDEELLRYSRHILLTELGIEEANTGGKALADYGIKFDIAFTSDLKRAQDTCVIGAGGAGAGQNQSCAKLR